MDEIIHSLLISIDEVGSWEHPRDFDYKGYWAELEAIQPLVEQVMSEPFTFDRYVQDASFFTDLNTEPLLWDDNILYPDWCIRFSNFGRLFSVIGAVVNEPDRQDQKHRLITLLESKGFHYISEDEASELYDGKNPPYQEGLTWWIRYFDYL